MFNPLSRRGLKYWNYLIDFKRANRRMHNKSFTVDNSMSIVGGRNIGEENAWGYKPEMVTLHSKATIIDRETIFIGSLNFDPRSILINTEMGLFIESAKADAKFADAVVLNLERVAYRVDLDEKVKR